MPLTCSNPETDGQMRWPRPGEAAKTQRVSIYYNRVEWRHVTRRQNRFSKNPTDKVILSDGFGLNFCQVRSDQILNVEDRKRTARRATSISGYCRVSSCGCVLGAGRQPYFEPLWIVGKLLRNSRRKVEKWLKVQRVDGYQERKAAFEHIRNEGAETTALGLVFPEFVNQDQIDRFIQP